ncbi:unnamed protein product [Lactuca virosa]|uniref:Uncharacterized protein n=1 Tax=Lactuca virosa TaxID=75947 RepID=A0AAU9NLL6_9ASTR|nr:unnamed protein product [Lactuca virosa]
MSPLGITFHHLQPSPPSSTTTTFIVSNHHLHCLQPSSPHKESLMVLEGRPPEVAGFAGKLTGIRNNEQREEGLGLGWKDFDFDRQIQLKFQQNYLNLSKVLVQIELN